jgi:hypothetical protein
MPKSQIPTDTAGLIAHLLETLRDQRTTLLVDKFEGHNNKYPSRLI